MPGYMRRYAVLYSVFIAKYLTDITTDYVNNNPLYYQNAYFNLASLNIYQ
jgi:hypothetical protein